MMDAPRQEPLHHSLIRPRHLAGADVQLAVMNWCMAAILIFGTGYHRYGLIAGLLFATLGHWALVQAQRFDPHFRQIYLRQYLQIVLFRQAFYPAQSRVSAPPAPVTPSVDTTDRR